MQQRQVDPALRDRLLPAGETRPSSLSVNSNLQPEQVEVEEPQTTTIGGRVFAHVVETNTQVKRQADNAGDKMFWCTKAILSFIRKLPGWFLNCCQLLNALVTVVLLGNFVYNYYTALLMHDIHVLNPAHTLYGEADILINGQCDFPSLLRSQKFNSYYGMVYPPITNHTKPPSASPTMPPSINFTTIAPIIPTSTTIKPSVSPTPSPTGPSFSPTPLPTGPSPAPTQSPIRTKSPTQSPVLAAAFLIPMSPMTTWKIRVQTAVAFFVWLKLRQNMFFLVPQKLSFSYLLYTLLQNAVSWCFRHWGFVETSPCSVVYSVYYDRLFQTLLWSFAASIVGYYFIIWVFGELVDKKTPNERVILKPKLGGRKLPNGGMDVKSKCFNVVAYLVIFYAVVVPAAWVGVNNVRLSFMSKKKTHHPLLRVVDILVFAVDTVLVFPLRGFDQFTLAAFLQSAIMVMDVCICVLSFIYERTPPSAR